MGQQIYVQNTFAGGLDQRLDATKIQDNEYPFLQNGRNRFDTIDPIPQAVLQANLPVGNYQGVYGAGNFLIVFISGLAFYKDYSIPLSGFNQIIGFKMDANVPVIYACLVTQAINHDIRQTNTSTPTDTSAPIVTLVDPNGSSPQCVVCQDGINQPFLIFSNGSTRPAQTFAQWLPSGTQVADPSSSAREYVPIGLQMLYYGGVLFVVSTNGQDIYPSVKGRPLDFVVVIDANGNKIAGEDATASAHHVSFNNLTGLFPAGTPDGAIVACTLYSTTLVTPDSTATFFGEASYDNVDVFPTGAINQFSFLNVLGDNLFITLDGIKSFNATKQTKFTGNNTPFSQIIKRLLSDANDNPLPQNFTPCCLDFNNYAFFFVNTIFGLRVIVFDELSNVFVSIDNWQGIGQIKQFATIKLAATYEFFFITTDNRLFQALADPINIEQCSVYVGEWIHSDNKISLKPSIVKLILTEIYGTGTITASVYGDKVATPTLNGDVGSANPIPVQPITPPFAVGPLPDTRNLLFTFDYEGFSSTKVGVYLQWNFKCKLLSMELVCDELAKENTISETSKSQSEVLAGFAIINNFAPIAGHFHSIIYLVGTGFTGVSSVFVNNIPCDQLAIADDEHMQFRNLSNTSGLIQLVKNNAISYSQSQLIVS